MPFTLDIDVYAGPLDLLLHVVRANRIDMLELPLGTIAESFLGYARTNPELNLEEAGEVIYTASLLLRMKVRFLLPSDEPLENGDKERFGERDEELEELYHGIVAAARELAANEDRQRRHFPRGDAAGPPEIDDTEVLLQDVGVMHLAEAFREVERKLQSTPARQLTLFKVTVEEQAYLILRALEENKFVSFQRLVESLTERIEVVVTFLALLDLLRLRRIKLQQDELFGEIVIRKGPKYDGLVIRDPEVLESQNSV